MIQGPSVATSPLTRFAGHFLSDEKKASEKQTRQFKELVTKAYGQEAADKLDPKYCYVDEVSMTDELLMMAPFAPAKLKLALKIITLGKRNTWAARVPDADKEQKPVFVWYKYKTLPFLGQKLGEMLDKGQEWINETIVDGLSKQKWAQGKKSLIVPKHVAPNNLLLKIGPRTPKAGKNDAILPNDAPQPNIDKPDTEKPDTGKPDGES